MNVQWHKWPEERPPTETPLLMLFMDRLLREDAQRQVGIGRFYSFPKERGGDVFWLASAWTTLQCIHETVPQQRIEILAWDVIEEDDAFDASVVWHDSKKELPLIGEKVWLRLSGGRLFRAALVDGCGIGGQPHWVELTVTWNEWTGAEMSGWPEWRMGGDA